MRHRPRNSASIWATRLLAGFAVLLLLLPMQAAWQACIRSSIVADERPAADAGEPEPGSCCPSERSSEPSDEPHQNCPCPFPCAVGCGGPPRAIVSAIALPELVPLPAAVVFTPAAQRAPPNPEPVGIMHVPILAAT